MPRSLWLMDSVLGEASENVMTAGDLAIVVRVSNDELTTNVPIVRRSQVVRGMPSLYH